MKFVIQRKCPFCHEFKFFIEQIGKANLYYLSCASPNTSAGFYVEQTNTNRYRKVVTYIPQKKTREMTAFQKKEFDKLQVPFWKLMGQKAKTKDVMYEKYLKSKNMTYGDAVLERDYQRGKHKNAYESFQKTR